MTDASHAGWRALALVLAAVSADIACIAPRPRPQPSFAVIESGDATIHRIDRMAVDDRLLGRYEVLPGGHTLDITAIGVEHFLFSRRFHRSGLMSLCLKARAGSRYRIKTTVKQGQLSVFVIDTATGKPPVTPCGPDEDED